MSIYNDHIRLWNEGKLPEDLSIEKLMSKHTSKPRNPKMAEAFYRAGFIEAWGRGIEKIVNGFKADGLTPPTFEIEQGGMTVNIPRERFVAINLNGTTDGEQSGVGGKDGGKDEPNQNRTKTELKPNQNRTKKEEKDQIIELIQEQSWLYNCNSMRAVYSVALMPLRKREEYAILDQPMAALGRLLTNK
jgi:ATP-dependent DNA helicase RecG